MARRKSKKNPVQEIEEMCKEMLSSASDSEKKIILHQLDLCQKQQVNKPTPSGGYPSDNTGN